MPMDPKHRFPGPVTVFRERQLPELATPAGYAALVDTFRVPVPLPQLLCAISHRSRAVELDNWRLFSPSHTPEQSLEGHLQFALKYEGLDLGLLKQLFLILGPSPIEQMVRSQPTGRYSRRLWFLYEWLLNARLDLPDVKRSSYVEALDPKQQWAGATHNSPRHRVRNNLPGTPAFCPLVRRTAALDQFAALGLSEKAKAIAARTPADLLARTAAFLLLKDSRASYVIEGEDPPQDRIQRWGRAIGQAGRAPITLDELLRLQQIVIGDARFVHMGLRTQGGFIGQHDRKSRTPIPDHVSARHQDLVSLTEGLVAFDRDYAAAIDPVIAAAVLAFGFVFIHPFEDGNGRIHRYLIHHTLAARNFNPPGVVFPVSAAILSRINAYRATLESYSRGVLPLIDWRPTGSGNIEVLNDTADYYRYFDATAQAEFLYACVQQTVEHDLPEETAFLRRYDAFGGAVKAIVEMPDSLIDLLFRMLQQGDGKLSKRAREKEFATLTDAEVEQIESAFAERS